MLNKDTEVIIITDKLTDEERKKIKDQLMAADISPLIGARCTIKERAKEIIIDTDNNIHERIRVIVETECKDDFGTYTWNTIAEINQMLNSNMDFINIRDIVVKRESVVGVYKIEEQSKEDES